MTRIDNGGDIGKNMERNRSSGWTLDGSDKNRCASTEKVLIGLDVVDQMTEWKYKMNTPQVIEAWKLSV
jgi:hypothetical protein